MEKKFINTWRNFWRPMLKIWWLSVFVVLGILGMITGEMLVVEAIIISFALANFVLFLIYIDATYKNNKK